VVEHECTSRTLFVRNISSNTEDKELVDLFEFYGDIRDMYSACKYRGFVMISFFDERAATAAMDCLQGKALSRRKLDIHFSIPKENQVDAGMLLVFNLEQKTPNSVIATLFRAFGDIKSIKSMQNHNQPMDQNSRIAIRMIEYYDERHAAAALKALNGADVWNIKIRIQFGRVSRVVSHHQKRQSLRTNEYSGLSGQEDLLVNNQVGYHDHGAPSADQDYQAGCNIHLQQPQQQQQQQQIFMPPRRYQMHHNSGDQGLPGPSGDTMTGQQTHQHQGYPPHRHSNHHNSHNSHFAYDSHHQQQQHGSNYKRMGGGHPHQHQAKNKSHFSLNLQNIMEGKDRKTTVMIRNIPNKYTQKMLLAEIDVELKGKYDFFYLPIDFKNKCNVGYAFMNLIDPFCILKLYEQFNGKRWSHFNSGKICEITYARIQGKQALTAHFRHSALMQVDEECQPMFPYGQAPVYNQQENTTYA
jgi:RNA recognition motif-containing protein